MMSIHHHHHESFSNLIDLHPVMINVSELPVALAILAILAVVVVVVVVVVAAAVVVAAVVVAAAAAAAAVAVALDILKISFRNQKITLI